MSRDNRRLGRGDSGLQRLVYEDEDEYGNGDDDDDDDIMIFPKWLKIEKKSIDYVYAILPYPIMRDETINYYSQSQAPADAHQRRY